MTLRTVTGIVIALTLAALPLGASAAGLGVDLGLHASANAGASTSVNASLKVGDKIATAKARGDQEIDRRVGNLTTLSTRFDGMQKLDASSQAALSASLEAQINALTALKAKIDADDSTTTLRADIQSITKSYRVYMLVMPQASITAAGDRALNVASLLDKLSTKLSARIASSTDASLSASLSDMNAKIADAKVQAQAAIDGVASLQPDNGDQTVATANTAALKAARAKVQAAQQDLVAARKDAGTIVKALGGEKASVTASTTTSVETH